VKLLDKGYHHAVKEEAWKQTSKNQECIMITVFFRMTAKLIDILTELVANDP